MTRRVSIPTTLSEIAVPDSSSLVIWDMQEGIARRAHNLSSMRTAAQRVLAAAREAGTLVIWSKHVLPSVPVMSPVALRNLMRRQGVASPDLLKPSMQAGSPEVGFIEGFVPGPDELVLEKSTPSLFIGTPLELRLRPEIRTLLLAGVATNAGIEMTARHATALGYFVVVVEDAVGAFTAKEHEDALERLGPLVDLADSESVVRAWGSGR